MTNRTIFETALTILAWAALAIDSTFAEEETRVFIFAGQSNMVGADAMADHIDDFPYFQGAGTPQKHVLYSYILGSGDEASRNWTPL